jgi:hypothetical protein
MPIRGRRENALCGRESGSPLSSLGALQLVSDLDHRGRICLGVHSSSCGICETAVNQTLVLAVAFGIGVAAELEIHVCGNHLV